MKEYSISYGDKTIDFNLERRSRKTMEISVLPDMSVLVVASEDVPLDTIMMKVKKRAGWIVKQKDYFSEFHPQEPPRKYVSGETHRYLGRQYRLKVIHTERNDVKLKGKYITIKSRKTNDREYNERLLYGWYRKHAEKKFAEIIVRCLETLSRYSIENPTVEIKSMKSRWGSCVSRKNKIILNTGLIKAPSHCIEYVIMHELCHLKYPNHDKDFYTLISLIMPDWQERKKRLEMVFI